VDGRTPLGLRTSNETSPVSPVEVVSTEKDSVPDKAKKQTTEKMIINVIHTFVNLSIFHSLEILRTI
jgi:hypothetical protein